VKSEFLMMVPIYLQQKRTFNMKKITITFIGATLLSAASYATPQATVDISLLKSEAMSIVKCLN
jgi:hypothetical protein